jgi:hypothetical protein
VEGLVASLNVLGELRERAAGLRLDIPAIRTELAEKLAELQEIDAIVAALETVNVGSKSVTAVEVEITQPMKTAARTRKKRSDSGKKMPTGVTLNDIDEWLYHLGPAFKETIASHFNVLDHRGLAFLHHAVKRGKLGLDDAGKFYSLRLK